MARRKIITRKRASGGRKKSRRGRWRRRVIAVAVVAVLAASAWLFWPLWRFSERFGEQRLEQPSRLFGDPVHLVVGRSLDATRVIEELDALGYRRVGDSRPGRGQYAYGSGVLKVHLRSFPTPWGWNSGGTAELRWSRQHLAALRWRGEAVTELTLEPPLLFAYYGPDRQERRPVPLDAISRDLIQAVLAAEDASFFQHPGLSLRGIARAAWVNLRSGDILQGGSTLTQQLVKNLFLTGERTLIRKLREALLAVVIDGRYDKEEILSAYLNEIYWGSSGGVSLMGVGAAAQAYFGKEASSLTLCESAVLAGMISSPGTYSPTARPERSKERRDWVLGRLADLGWLESAKMEAARNEPLCVSPVPTAARRAPYFGDRMALEAQRRFGLDRLDDTGYVLLSSVGRRDQEAAEAAIDWGLVALESGWEKGAPAKGPLQAALISIDPRSGAIRAYVGGRDFRQSQFDRVSQAKRQAGSAFKPVVYATAFVDHRAAPSTLLEDTPLTVSLAGRHWSPQNADSTFRGWVSVRTALENSLNVPTARLALEVGLQRVVQVARAMGIESRLQPVPALALGAFEVTPLELASVYAVLASGGVRREVHGLRAVLDPRGKPLEGRSLAEPRRVLSAQSVFLLTSVLQGVLDRGTASTVRIQGLTDPLAGKTGTTNDRRDSWFAGYSPDRVSLVWVGYDDNSPTRLSGARAALPIWARFTYKVRPGGGYPVFGQPSGVATAVIDPASGQLATDDCPQVLTEVFLEGSVPSDICQLHGGWRADRAWPTSRVEQRDDEPRWRWLRRLFGRQKNRPARPPG